MTNSTKFTLHMIVGIQGMCITHVHVENPLCEETLMIEMEATDAESFIAEVLTGCESEAGQGIGVFQIDGEAYIDTYAQGGKEYISFHYEDVTLTTVLGFENTAALAVNQ